MKAETLFSSKMAILDVVHGKRIQSGHGKKHMDQNITSM
jgi:hypothetical protein